MSAIAYGAGRCQPVSSEESGGKTVMPTRVGGGWLNQAFDVFSSAPTIRNKTKNTTSMANSVRCAFRALSQISPIAPSPAQKVRREITLAAREGNNGSIRLLSGRTSVFER